MKRILATSTGVVAIALATAGAEAGQTDRQDFLKDAIKGDNSEIMLGRPAARNGGSNAVREYGCTLAADHQKAKAKASRVARQIGVSSPSRAVLKAEAEYLKLRALSGNSFDRDSVSYMIDDHEQDIRDFSHAARIHRGPVGDLAQEELPTLRKHFRMAESFMKP